MRFVKRTGEINMDTILLEEKKDYTLVILEGTTMFKINSTDKKQVISTLAEKVKRVDKVWLIVEEI